MTAPAGPLAELAARGFARVPGTMMTSLIGEAGRPAALAAFFASWIACSTRRCATTGSMPACAATTFAT